MLGRNVSKALDTLREELREGKQCCTCNGCLRKVDFRELRAQMAECVQLRKQGQALWHTFIKTVYYCNVAVGDEKKRNLLFRLPLITETVCTRILLAVLGITRTTLIRLLRASDARSVVSAEHHLISKKSNRKCSDDTRQRWVQDTIKIIRRIALNQQVAAAILDGNLNAGSSGPQQAAMQQPGPAVLPVVVTDSNGAYSLPTSISPDVPARPAPLPPSGPDGMGGYGHNHMQQEKINLPPFASRHYLYEEVKKDMPQKMQMSERWYENLFHDDNMLKMVVTPRRRRETEKDDLNHDTDVMMTDINEPRVATLGGHHTPPPQPPQPQQQPPQQPQQPQQQQPQPPQAQQPPQQQPPQQPLQQPPQQPPPQQQPQPQPHHPHHHPHHPQHTPQKDDTALQQAPHHQVPPPVEMPSIGPGDHTRREVPEMR